MELIQKFTNNKYKNTNLEKTALPITEDKIYKESFLNFSNDNICNYQNLVIFENNLIFKKLKNYKGKEIIDINDLKKLI